MCTRTNNRNSPNNPMQIKGYFPEFIWIIYKTPKWKFHVFFHGYTGASKTVSIASFNWWAPCLFFGISYQLTTLWPNLFHSLRKKRSPHWKHVWFRPLHHTIYRRIQTNNLLSLLPTFLLRSLILRHRFFSPRELLHPLLWLNLFGLVHWFRLLWLSGTKRNRRSLP